MIIFIFMIKKKKEDIKINNIDNFGKLIIKDENERNKLVENIFKRESNKSKDIAVKQIKDRENKYSHSKEIQLTYIKYVNQNKKEKRVRKNQLEVDNFITYIVPKKPEITAREIADELNIPENQAKETLNRLCDYYIDNNTRRRFYHLKNEL